MNKRKTIILALMVMFLWGSLFPMVKLGFSNYNVTTTGDILLFAGIRFTICGAIICLFAFIKEKKDYTPVRSTFFPIMSSGLFAIVLHYAFTYLGLSITDSSKTAILKQVGVLFYICFSSMFFKTDKLTMRKGIGVLLGFLGIIAINTSTEGFSFGVGDVLIIAASFCTIFSNIISKKVFQKVEPITATGCSQLFGGVVLLFVGLICGGSVEFSLDWSLLIMVYICIASIFGYCIWYKIIKTNELSNMFIIKFAEPLFSCLLGALILKENILQWQYLVAFMLISGGIIISNLNLKKEAQTKGADASKTLE